MTAVADGSNSTEAVASPMSDKERAKRIDELRSRIAEMELQLLEDQEEPLYDSSVPLNRQLDLSDPDRLRRYMIFLRLPKSGAPRNYEKWYRSFIPLVVSDDPDKIPRLTYARKPEGYGSFQAMLSPRQVQDMMKLPGFDDFGDLDRFY